MTSDDRSTDKRTETRYPIVAPVVWEHGEGVTWNVSASGVYFVTATPLNPGQQLRVKVTLPRLALPLEGNARVVRVEPKSNGFGVGVKLEHLDVPSFTEAPSAGESLRGSRKAGPGTGAPRRPI